MKIDHPQDPNCTTDSIQADVNAAQKVYGTWEFCFTWQTVQALLDKIDELQVKISDMDHTADRNIEEMTDKYFHASGNPGVDW